MDLLSSLTRFLPSFPLSTTTMNPNALPTVLIDDELPNEILLNLLKYTDLHDFERILLVLKALAGKTADGVKYNKDELPRNDIIGGLHNILDHYSEITTEESQEILSCALMCLRHVTKGDALSIIFATECELIPLCKDLMEMFPDAVKIQTYGCMVFRSLTFNRADNQASMVRMGVVPLIMSALVRHDNSKELHAAAFMCIQNLTWLVERNRLLINDHHGIELILSSLVKHKDDLNVVKWGCGALQNLACCSQCTSNMIRLGILDIMKDILETKYADPSLYNYAIGVLRNIAYIRHNRILIFNSGLLRYVFLTMSRNLEDLEIQVSVLCLLFNACIDQEEQRKKLACDLNFMNTVAASNSIHCFEGKFSDKLTTLMDILSKNSSEPYLCTERKHSATLVEIALRECARQHQDVLISTLQEEIKFCEKCAFCEKYYRNELIVSVKESDRWYFKKACSTRCINDYIEKTSPASRQYVSSPVQQTEI